MKHLPCLPLLLFTLLLTACGGGGSAATAQTGFLNLSATDAPIDPALVESAEVTVERVRIHRSEDEDVADDDGGWTVIFDGPARTLPLSDLRNGITAVISEAELPVGAYGQLRLHLAGGELVLVDGDTFSTEDGSLHMPSAMNSAGLKVQFDEPITVEPDATRDVVLDFDLSKTFKPVPGNAPLDANHYNLHPVIRVAVLNGSGDLSVTVRQDDGAGNLVGVASAVVYVLEPGAVVLDEAVASSITDGTGTAVVMGLQPGSYDVRAVFGPDEAQVDGVVVSAGETTLLDVDLP